MKLFTKGQGNLIKILSLTIGLAIGLILIAKVNWEEQYDKYIDDVDNVYNVCMHYVHENDGEHTYTQSPGGIIPALLANFPYIEAGTRVTPFFGHSKLLLDDNTVIVSENTLYADSCFFDIFSRKIFVGNAQALAHSGSCLISQTLANRIGGNVVGRRFAYDSFTKDYITIEGIYEDFPENASFANVDILLSLPTIGVFSYDGTNRLMGNERYHSFVKLSPDTDREELTRLFNEKLKSILPISQEEMHLAGYLDYSFLFRSIEEGKYLDSQFRTTNLIMLIVAIILLSTAIFNYILVVISSLVKRVKGISVRKCYGAPDREFYISSIYESLVHLAISLIIVAVIFTLGKGVIRNLLGASVESLFSLQSLAILSIVCLVVLLICGVVPGYIYANLPIKYVFNRFNESRRWWKLTLLTFQFILSTTLLSVVFVIYSQYSHLINKDLGYNYDNVAVIDREGDFSEQQFVTIANELSKLSCVENVGTTTSLFCDIPSGDNISLPGDPKCIFNCGNLFYSSIEALKAFGIEIVRGEFYNDIQNTTSNSSRSTYDTQTPQLETIIDERFETMLKEATGWDNVIGREIKNSSFSNNAVIKGVYRKVTTSSLMVDDNRPCQMFNYGTNSEYIIVRLTSVSAENMDILRNKALQLSNGALTHVYTYKSTIISSYNDTRRTRDLIIIGCFATLIITMVGLIGYVRDEAQRRRRELAIRKVLGASVIELLQLFINSISRLALPAIFIGIAFGFFICERLMEQFPDHISLSWYYFAIAAIIVIVVIISLITIKTVRITRENPIEHIKAE